MHKTNYFKKRIIMENMVYLLAKDVADALGFADLNSFMKEHSEIVENTDALFPELVLESDFNNLLVSNEMAFQRLGHIEITKVDTLRSQTESIKSFYPLKYMIEGEILKNKAFSAGYKSVEEYLERVELPKDIDEEREKFLSKEDILHSLNSSDEKIKELVDIDVLNQYDLSVQQYIHIKDGIPYSESFIAGKGIFFALYDSDYVFNSLKVIDSDLIVPTYDIGDEFADINYGHDADMRDYRKYSTLDNILHIITHKKVEDVGVDLLYCESPGINFYISQTEVIKLLNPNMYRDVVLINGTVDFDCSRLITKNELKGNNCG